MRFLILANLGDTTPVHVAARLRRRHRPADVRLVAAEELIFAPRWTHRLFDSPGGNGLTLHDGTAIRSDSVQVVFNRLGQLSMPHFGASPAADRDYALMEMSALLLSWLSSFSCPVINRPAPQGLAGVPRSWLGWMTLAGKTGLSPAPARLEWPVGSSGPSVPAAFPDGIRFQVLVAGSRVVGHCESGLAARCVVLAKAANCELLRLYFVRLEQSRPACILTGADPLPPLVCDAELDAVAALLESRAGRTA